MDAALSEQKTWASPVGDLLSEVDRTVTEADRFATASGLDADRRYAVQICLEEALANIIMHAKATSGSKRVEVELSVFGAVVKVLVSDACEPFDVTKAVSPAPGREQEPGGRGIRLLRAFSRRMQYWTDAGRNYLEIEI